jgi:hypothetical protein
VSAHATEYTLNQAIGAGGVTGTISTDGQLGSLVTADITDWNITINDGTSTFNLLGPLSVGANSQIELWGGLTATLTDLEFDFSQSADGLLIQNPYIGSAENWFALDNTAGWVAGHPGSESIRVGFGVEQATPFQGVTSIAQTTGAQEVPDIGSTVMMLSSALAGLLGFSRRFRK